MDEKPTKPKKRPKSTKRAAPANVSPRKPPSSNALIDSTTLPDDLREFIYRENQRSQKYAIEGLLDAAEKYRAEMGRTDGAHRARMSDREKTLFLRAEDLMSTHCIFAKLTYRDLEDWQRRMEWAAERERNNPAPEPALTGKAETAQLIPFQPRPVEPKR